MREREDPYKLLPHGQMHDDTRVYPSVYRPVYDLEGVDRHDEMGSLVHYIGLR